MGRQPEEDTWHAVRRFHDRAISRAYELGRNAAAEGKDNECPEVCNEIDAAFNRGWRDEKAGKP